MPHPNYAKNVFVNCPFDDEYTPIFLAILFTIYDCVYEPRCSLESHDAGEVRIDKILRIIHESKLGIHDISRTELDATNNLPRFNMPFELGIFIGARRFGNPPHSDKYCLVLEKEQYRYHKYLSDIAGQDIKAHFGEIQKTIAVVRDWLNTETFGTIMPGPTKILGKYLSFSEALPEVCVSLGLDPEAIHYNDYIFLISTFLRTAPP
jgi:hypothetical protein